MRARAVVFICLLAVAISLGVTWGFHAVRGATSSARQDPFALLDLTPEQRLRIQDLLREFHPRLLELEAAAQASRARLADTLVERGDDAHALASCLREVEEAEAALDREVVRNLLLLKPHLTPAQQSTLFRYIQLRHSQVERAARKR